jgi:hypothetical protein
MLTDAGLGLNSGFIKPLFFYLVYKSYIVPQQLNGASQLQPYQGGAARVKKKLSVCLQHVFLQRLKPLH